MNAFESMEPEEPRRGRPPAFDLTAAEVAAARAARARKRSLAVAVEAFLMDPAVRPEVAARIRAMLDEARAERRRPHWPMSLQRAFHVTANEEAAFRGRKSLERVRYKARRGLFFLDDQGEAVPLRAHDCWELDDYSTNQPFWWTDADGEPVLGRQVLMGMDVASAGWLGALAVGRDRDSYRKEDIAHFVLQLILSHGTLPLVLRLERGRWENSAVHGIPLTDDEEGPRWGSWEALFRVEHVLTSGAKGLIEGSFGVLQDRLGHEGRDLGRSRGEFEAAARDLRRAQAGTVHPREAGFLHQDLAMRLHVAAGEAMNAAPRRRDGLGGRMVVPAEVLEAGPREVRPLPAAEAWRFLPFKARGTVRNGIVELADPRTRGRTVSYRVNGVDERVFLDQGFRVFVAFDPADPSRGAAVANRETGSANREGWGLGQVLLAAAPAEVLQPQFTLRAQDGDFRAKAASDAAARRAFAAIGLRGRAAGSVRLVDESDGRGSRAEVRHGLRDAAATVPPTRREAPAMTPPDRGGAPEIPTPRRDRMMELLGINP